MVGALGWLNSSVAIPSSDIFAPLNLGMISVGATNPVLTARGKSNVFRVVADDDYQAPAQYLYLKKAISSLKSIALVDESTESTTLMNDRVQKPAEPTGSRPPATPSGHRTRTSAQCLGPFPKT